MQAWASLFLGVYFVLVFLFSFFPQVLTDCVVNSTWNSASVKYKLPIPFK